MKRAWRGILIGCSAAIIVALVVALDPNLFGLEPLVYDAMTRRVARSIQPDPRIVLIAIGEKSVHSLEAQYGRPQSYPRSLYAMVIDEVRRGGGKVIAFDNLFAESNVGQESDDLEFARALATMPTVLAAQTGQVARTSSAFQPLLWKTEGSTTLPIRSLQTPLDTFSTTKAIGTIRWDDSRHYSIGDRVGPALFIPSLATATAAEFLALPREIRFQRDGGARIGSLDIPGSGDTGFLVRWAGATLAKNELTYTPVDFDRVITAALLRANPDQSPYPVSELDRFDREKFKDRIVLVGLTAAGMDLRPNPLATQPGVVIHANAVDNLINGRFVRSVSLQLILPAALIACALLGFLLYQVRSQLAAIALTTSFITAWLGTAYALLAQGTSILAAAPSIALLLTYASTTVVRYVAEQDQSRQLRRTFGRYVSPQILEHILAHPEKVELGGDRVDLTVLFSDIRGFTSISEAAEPEEVVEMLNEYLTRMVEILLRHGGTLDKFIGDAVMGFWNAPTADPDHALHAVQCAIEMLDETARLRKEWEPQGKAAIRIGVGINTGDAVVGNIGATQVFSYTVIGDAVNLASRLESKNKDYGTEIIISEFTLARIGDAIPTTYLDDVKVKGKEKAVKIYQVKGTVE